MGAPSPARGAPSRRHHRKAAAAIALPLLAIVLGHGRQALAYRPFDGTDADVARAGEFELELGPAHLYREAGTTYLIAPASMLNLGVADRVELVADFKNFVAASAPAPGGRRIRLRDTDLLAKAVLRQGCLQGKGGPSLALEAGVLLPELGASTGLGSQADAIVSLGNDKVLVHFNESIAGNRDHHLEL
jgi:hypothetical protein